MSHVVFVLPETMRSSDISDSNAWQALQLHEVTLNVFNLHVQSFNSIVLDLFLSDTTWRSLHYIIIGGLERNSVFLNSVVLQLHYHGLFWEKRDWSDKCQNLKKCDLQNKISKNSSIYFPSPSYHYSWLKQIDSVFKKEQIYKQELRLVNKRFQQLLST